MDSGWSFTLFQISHEYGAWWCGVCCFHFPASHWALFRISEVIPEGWCITVFGFSYWTRPKPLPDPETESDG
jgi:hypothetical protein